MTDFVGLSCRKKFLVTLGFLISFSVYSQNTLKLIRKIPHSGYSEGLDFHEGFLWHSLPKQILKIDPKDGSILEKWEPPTDYSESLVWFKGKLWNLSYSDNSIHVANLDKGKFIFKKVGKTPEVHGWGMTEDGENIIITGDYSSKLYYLDPITSKVVKTLNTDAKDIEDLAYDGKRLWASSFTVHRGEIFSIDTKTGKVLQYYSLHEPSLCPIVDGIAIQKGVGLWIVGKECPSIFLYELPK